jgi:TolB-like protein
VLYFDDHSPEQSLAYLAGGLTEGLIRELAAVPALDVVSRGGVKQYRASAVSTDSIARQLRAGSIVEGSVQRWRDRLRLTVHLVDGATGRQLESETVERPVGDLFALEDELSRHVSRFLRQRLGEEVRLRERERGTANAAAVELVLRAEQLREDAVGVGRSGHARDSLSARGLLAEADSLLALAESLDRRWVEPPLLRGWNRMARGALADRGSAVREFAAALEHAERALALRPEHPGALELRGTLRWRFVVVDPAAEGNEARLEAAERDLREAVRRNPGQASAWGTLSQFLRFRGDLAEADRAAVRALETDAYLEDAPRIVERLYRSALMAPEYARARDWCARGRRDYADDWRFVECQLVLMARDPSAVVDVGQAERLLRELDSLDPADRVRRENRGYTPVHRRMVYAAVLARAGRADSARQVVADARERLDPGAETLASFHYDEALVRLLLRENDAAERALARVTELRPHLRENLARDPLFRNPPPPPSAPRSRE